MAWCDHVFGDRPRWWGISQGIVNDQDRIWLWNFDGTMDSIGVSYTPGVWTHITLVHDGGVMRAYKNGVLAGAMVSGPTQQPNTGALPILQLGGVINTANACGPLRARWMRCSFGARRVPRGRSRPT